jgi:hypothetical protein
MVGDNSAWLDLYGSRNENLVFVRSQEPESFRRAQSSFPARRRRTALLAPGFPYPAPSWWDIKGGALGQLALRDPLVRSECQVSNLDLDLDAVVDGLGRSTFFRTGIYRITLHPFTSRTKSTPR